MYVEAPVEVTIADKTFTSSDPYDLKLWLQRAFKSNACYRISDFKAGPARTFKAVVAVNARILPEAEWKQLETGTNPAAMRRFVETTFAGKGTLKCAADPKIKAS
ncbi:MAG TPA: hypothetical protein VGK67_25145 [Myxococcales bacterium]|jgi:hypothetical protein